MTDRTEIGYVDASWNPVIGCPRGTCRAHCYAERMAARLASMPGEAGDRYRQVVDGGRWNGRVRLVPSELAKPLHWRKPRRVLVPSMGDLFGAHWTDVCDVFMVMRRCPQHTFIVPTKQSGWMVDTFSHLMGFDPWPLPNVWLGVSVEDQAAADERIPHLLRCPAAKRWVSYEPALGAVDFGTDVWGGRLDWIVCGGASGPNARPCHIDWLRSVVAQCKAAGVACYVKQLGANPVGCRTADAHFYLSDRAGRDPDEWPADLRVREFPT